MRLGIDVGGVITDRVNDHTDTSFLSDNYLETTAVPGAFETIRSIGLRIGVDYLFIVSKCGSRVERKTREWLEHKKFFDLTGMSRENLYFCLKREDKAPICQRLGITHFIDDRIDVLCFMDGVVGTRFLFMPKDWAHVPREIIPVSSWEDLDSKIWAMVAS